MDRCTKPCKDKKTGVCALDNKYRLPWYTLRSPTQKQIEEAKQMSALGGGTSKPVSYVKMENEKQNRRLAQRNRNISNFHSISKSAGNAMGHTLMLVHSLVTNTPYYA